METKANYVAVGVFVLTCIVALVIAVLWLAGAQYREQYTLYQTIFPGPVTGLGRGTVVRYNGIDVGTVREVSFDANDPKRVLAVLQVDPSLRLHQDSTVSLESQGLTGGSYVEITGGTKEAPFLAAKVGERYPTIVSKQSAIQQIYESTPQLLQKLNTLAERGGDLLNDDNRKALTETFDNLRDISAAINNHDADIDMTLTNLGTATNKLNQLLISADDAAHNLSLLTNDADQVVKKGAVAQLDQLVAETRNLVTSLNHLTDDIDRQPTKLIFGDRRQGYTPQ